MLAMRTPTSRVVWRDPALRAKAPLTSVGAVECPACRERFVVTYASWPRTKAAMETRAENEAQRRAEEHFDAQHVVILPDDEDVARYGS
jgi:hypothetical protein